MQILKSRVRKCPEMCCLLCTSCRRVALFFLSGRGLKWLHVPRLVRSHSEKNSPPPRDPKPTWKNVIYTFFWSWNLHFSCSTKSVGEHLRLKRVHKLNRVLRVLIASFQINLGTRDFQTCGLTWKSFIKPFSQSFFGLFYSYLKRVSIYFSCLGECCQLCLAVKLQKVSMGFETWSDLPWAWGWIDNDWI